VVDHIKPHHGDQKLFWDPKNHQALCTDCHGAKTASEDGALGNPLRPGTARAPRPNKGCRTDGTPTDPAHPWNNR
jgi:5-methylcytosine-specific restriction endonuclease McrA